MSRRAFPTDFAPGTCEPEVFVNLWIGTPFKWDGRDRRGVDCWGLVWRYFRDVEGITLPDFLGAGGADWNAVLFAEHMASGDWRAFAAPREGALALSCPPSAISHAGVVVRGGVLHCKIGRGVVWEALGRFRQAYPSAQFGEWRGCA